jgi:hypothetical protein
MSWWIYIREPRGKETHYCDQCDHSHEADSSEDVFERNYTRNTSPMLRKAGTHWSEMEGKTGAEMYPIMVEVVKTMEAEPEEYKKLNPSNGWGDYDSFLQLLRDFRDCLKDHPQGVVHVSG